MLASLVLGVIAGVAVAPAEPHVRLALEVVLRGESDVTPPELRALTLVCLMGVAALAAAALGADTSAFALVLGAGLGHFGPALYRFARAPHNVPESERWDGSLRTPTGADDDREDRDAETLRSVTDALSGAPRPDGDGAESAEKERRE